MPRHQHATLRALIAMEWLYTFLAKLQQAEVKFMGRVISKDGLKPDTDKVIAIKNIPKPTSKPEVLTLL